MSEPLPILVCFYVCRCFGCVYVLVSGAHGDQKRSLDALELELEMIVSLHVDAGN